MYHSIHTWCFTFSFFFSFFFLVVVGSGVRLLYLRLRYAHVCVYVALAGWYRRCQMGTVRTGRWRFRGSGVFFFLNCFSLCDVACIVILVHIRVCGDANFIMLTPVLHCMCDGIRPRRQWNRLKPKSTRQMPLTFSGKPQNG